ncbi:MAG TPA: sulfurtransferase [Chitinophagales bacterium]|nr:sulfurtransferase [Chitinophagales bacterium]
METSIKKTPPLISPEELLQRMAAPDLVIIDARSGDDAYQRYAAHHLKGALHADLEKDLSLKPFNPANGGRHPLPDIRNFGLLLGKLGILPSSFVVVYDDKSGTYAAARFWWMLKAAGHEQVQVINGGLEAATRAGIPTSSKVLIPLPTTNYPVDDWKLPTVSIDDVAKASTDPEYLIIDVREKYRYLGESEPIDLVAGHIPNAVNVPYSENLTSDGSFLPSEKLSAIYKSIISDHKPNKVIVHCGSGVTGCHTILALEQAGISGVNLYVGSWSEWSRNPLPIATGK